MHIAIPFCTSIPAPGFYQDFVEGIESAAAALGHSSERIAFAQVERLEPAEADALFAWSRRSRCDLVIDLCCWGYGLSRVRLWNADGSVGATLFDSLGARYCALLYDQPYFQPLPWIESESLVVGCPDQDHPGLIPAIYPSVKMRASAFIPPATRIENDCSPARWADKTPGALYIGNLAPHALERFWNDHPHRRAYDAVADAALASPGRPLALCALETLRDAGIALEAGERVELLRSLEFWLRQRLRHRLVSEVARAGVPLRVHGRGWDAIGLPSNASIGPETDYNGFKALIGSARLALDASTYLGGANDRVFNFAINRTPFFTNARNWLAQAFGENSGALFYSPGDAEAIGARIRELLDRPAELERRAADARSMALAAHLWTHRLRKLIAVATAA